jgi:hypothetical protein
MRARSPAVVLAVALALAPEVARADVRTSGSCSGGSGDYRLDVQREDRNSLRVRFEIEAEGAGERWQVFVSDDGVRVFARTRYSNDDGDVRVRIDIADRAGTDRISASAANLDDGETCGGSVRF